MLVLDANTAYVACAAHDGFRVLPARKQPIGPPLLWPEVRSSLHVSVMRGMVSRDLALAAFTRLQSGRIELQEPAELAEQAWQIADELGWHKTYDAEYLALAKLLECPLLTLDTRVARAAQRVGVELQSLTDR